LGLSDTIPFDQLYNKGQKLQVGKTEGLIDGGFPKVPESRNRKTTQRGPCTFVCDILGFRNSCYLFVLVI
jgi:hypothetical protein